MYAILKKILLVIIALAVVAGIAGFLILPAVLKPVLAKKISEAARRETTIAQIRINPFDLSATIEGFQLADPGEKTPFVAFDLLRVNVDVPASLYRRALILEEMRLDNPYIGLTRREDGSYNFSDLLPREKEKKDKTEKRFFFSLNNIIISGGKIDFRDRPRKTSHSVRDLQLAVPFLSNIDYYMKNHVEPKFSAVVNGHQVVALGKTQPFLDSRDTSLTLDIKDIDVPFYLQYLPVKLNFRLSEARLDAIVQLHFMMSEKKTPHMKLTGRLELRKVSIDDRRGNKILRLPAMSVNIASVEPFVPKVHLAEIALNAPQLAISRNQKGVLNLLEMAGAEAKNKTKTPAASAAEKKKAPDVFVERLLVDRADISIMDMQPARPVTFHIQPLRLQVVRFSLAEKRIENAELEMMLDKKARILVQGPALFSPLSADLALQVKNLTIRPFQPYFPPDVQLDVMSGSISTAGKLLLQTGAGGKPRVRYSGKISVAKLTALDRAHHHNFLKWQMMSVSSIQAGYNPLFVNIGEIAFADLFAKIVINPGGRTNIEDIFGAPEREKTQSKDAPPAERTNETSPVKKETTKKQTAPPPDIKIAKVSFTGGVIDFADRNIRPNYAVTMLNLQGGVTGLSSQEISRAKVALKGNLGYGSPIEIVGAINPLKKDLFADIKISFKDVEMTPVTPYTNKYLGYPVTKGKLTFDVSYLVDQKKLTAENKIFFDQLTFGEKVESPEAIKAPVTLAVSLLTDRKGQINLDIPLTGSLDDPKFKIWPLVWQVLKNLIVKAVTAPFALLSSLTGGGEEMSFVEFEYGSAKLTEEGRKKVNALTRVLYERPNLKLEIAGYADVHQDAEALKKARFSRLLKEQKFKEIMDQGKDPGQLEEILIDFAEYEKYLTKAYAAAKLPKPRTAFGLVKKLPAAEMEKLLQNHIVIEESDLNQLTSRRALFVRENLLADGKIDPGRLFLVKASALAPGKKEKVKDSRVEFKLK